MTNHIAVTVSHAATLISARQNDLRQAIHDGRLPSFQMGRRQLICVTDLQAFVDGLKQLQTAGARR